MGARAGAEDLRQAAEVIRVKGHCKGTLQDSDGHVCLVGALMAVTEERFLKNGLTWAEGMANVKPVLMAVVAEQFPDRAGNAASLACLTYVGFNNHPDTTPEEVIAVLEKAAVRLEEAV